LKVNFYATYRAIVGQKTVEFDIPSGSTVQKLVDLIIERYHDFGGQLLDEQGNLYRHIHIFINGRDTYYLPHDLKTVLDPKDKIDIFPPVGGGTYEENVYVLRSMPVWLLQEYLIEIGGQPDDNGGYYGEGWSATIEKMENYTIGSLSVGQVRLIFAGEPLALCVTLPRLEEKMMRAGG
jgi:molybdopterin synthase sulfur carrier subunit